MFIASHAACQFGKERAWLTFKVWGLYHNFDWSPGCIWNGKVQESGGFIILKALLEKYEMDKEKINHMKAVISPCELLARRTVLDAWCVWYWAGASSAHLCCPSETTTWTGFLVPEEQNWWNRAYSQSLPLIFSLLNDRHLTWISMSKDIVLVLLRRHCFISGLCGWFQPSLSWWQLTHNSEITVHSFI